jgi:hypothetical protein
VKNVGVFERVRQFEKVDFVLHNFDAVAYE